jgi:hypothetical protein
LLGTRCSDGLVERPDDSKDQEGNDQPQDRLPGPSHDPYGNAYHDAKPNQ